jgi:hypothetical protein
MLTHCGSRCRCDTLSDDYLVLSTETFSDVSESLGGGPVTIQQDNRLENVELHASRCKVRSLMSKKDFARVGEEMLRHFERDGPNSSSKRPIPTDVETKVVMRLGVEVMLVGGVEACMLMGGIQDIKDEALAVRLPLQPPMLKPLGPKSLKVCQSQRVNPRCSIPQRPCVLDVVALQHTYTIVCWSRRGVRGGLSQW